MSSSAGSLLESLYLPSAFLYRDVAMPASVEREPEAAPENSPAAVRVDVGPTPEEVAGRIAAARAEAVAQTEARLSVDMQTQLSVQANKIKDTLAAFEEERKSYFERVESDVVHLALAIAAKILHRESQVDPLLIAALVRVAINKLHDGSRVTVRVGATEVDRWSEFLSDVSNGSTVQVVEDTHLLPGDCILETDLGSASFGIEAQLKEVEQGFFDLLAQRPAVR